MLCNRNLAENINAVSAYVKVYNTDRFFSVLPLHHCYESTIGFPVPWGPEKIYCPAVFSAEPHAARSGFDHRGTSVAAGRGGKR